MVWNSKTLSRRTVLASMIATATFPALAKAQ